MIYTKYWRHCNFFFFLNLNLNFDYYFNKNLADWHGFYFGLSTVALLAPVELACLVHTL
jgi:hypothetical protein